MAGFGWNMHHEHNHSRKRPFPTPQIACRICDQVFMSTQALINHIETHMIEDETAARRQHDINLMLSQSHRDPHAHHHLYPNNPPPHYHPNFTVSGPIRPPQPNIQTGFVHPQAFQDRNNPFSFPAAATTPRFIMPRPVPPTRLGRKTTQHGPELPAFTNMSQMRQYMATVDHPVDLHNPFSGPRQPTTNVPNAARPPLGRDHHQDQSKQTSDDTEVLDLTLRL